MVHGTIYNISFHRFYLSVRRFVTRIPPVSIHAIIVMREGRKCSSHLIRGLFVCGSPSTPSVLCRPYLAIQLSAARGQILEWVARGARLDGTVTQNSVQNKEGFGL